MITCFLKLIFFLAKHSLGTIKNILTSIFQQAYMFDLDNTKRTSPRYARTGKDIKIR